MFAFERRLLLCRLSFLEGTIGTGCIVFTGSTRSACKVNNLNFFKQWNLATRGIIGEKKICQGQTMSDAVVLRCRNLRNFWQSSTKYYVDRAQYARTTSRAERLCRRNHGHGLELCGFCRWYIIYFILFYGLCTRASTYY